MGPSESEVRSSSPPGTQDERHEIVQPLVTGGGIRVTGTAGETGTPDGFLGFFSSSGQPPPGTLASTNNSEPQYAQQQQKWGRDKRTHLPLTQRCCRKRAFTDLPREIRDRIYFWIMRPDCGLDRGYCGKSHECLHNGIGTTKILCLNRQIHREAIGLILAVENMLVLPNTGASVFRSMFSFGKPLFFHMATRSSRCRVPQQFCELNLVGLRYLAIKLRYPLPGNGEYVHPFSDQVEPVPRSRNYEKRTQALIQSARQTEAVLWK